MVEEWAGNADQIKADPGFRAALARRGVTDLSRVQVDPWPASNFGLEVDRSGRRLARGVAYVLDGPGSNPYARPVENLVAVLDRDTGEVIELIDGDVVPIPADPGRYDAASVGARRALAPLEILQPDGPGFTVDDGQLRWGPWQLRVSMHPIEGLVLHEICYVDGGRARPVLYRASMAEMVVPYGSTAPSHWWKNAFDAGDVGLGKTAASLDLGCDCLGEVVYLDAVTTEEDGTAIRPRARHLPARGGLRDPLEAHRHGQRRGRGAPVPPDGGLLHRQRRQLRLRLLLVLLPGRHDPGRGQADRHHPDAGDQARRAGAVRQPGHPGTGRAAPPAPVLFPARPVRRRPRELRLRGGRDRCSLRPGKSLRQRLHLPRHPAGDRGRRAAAGGARTRPLLEDRQPRVAERLRRARRLHAAPAAQCAAAGPGHRADQRARHVRHPAPVGHADPADERRPPASSRTRAPAATACPPGPPRTGRSPTPAIVVWHTVGTTHFCRPRTSR